jgi:hypothetical protein
MTKIDSLRSEWHEIQLAIQIVNEVDLAPPPSVAEMKADLERFGQKIALEIKRAVAETT